MTPGSIGDARTAFEHQSWTTASQIFAALATPLEPDDLDRRAIANYLCGREEEAFELWADGHRACAANGELAAAVRFGARLAQGLGFKGDYARAGGWLDRTCRLLDDDGIDSVEAGYVEHGRAMQCLLDSGDVPEAHARFVEARQIGERFGDAELITQARIGEGRMLIYLGGTRPGIALLDEAMVAVEAREIPAIAIGDAYCTVIDACRELFDLARMRTWTASLSRWCESQPDLVLYRGHCLLHRAEVMMFDGNWDAALVEVRRARNRLADPIHPATLGGALLTEGDLHRLRGDFDAAEAAYRLANEYDCEPQPGLSLLRQAQGRTDAANAAIARALTETGDPVGRARLLPAAIEIALAVGETDDARSHAHELTELAAAFKSDFLMATAQHGNGAVQLADHDPHSALATLQAARHLWASLHVPFQAARTRQLIADARHTIGDTDGAELERAAAQSTLQHLGAGHVPAGGADSAPAGLTPREIDVLRELAKGKTNRAIANELYISEKTVASHVNHIFTKLGVTTRSAATAFAYNHDLA